MDSNKEKEFLNKILSLLNKNLAIRIEAIDAPQLNNDKSELDMWIKIKIKINQKGEANNG